jgi:hypothetical protein
MIGTVSNGEQLLEVRNKLNETINQVNDIGTVSSSVQGQIDELKEEYLDLYFSWDIQDSYLPINNGFSVSATNSISALGTNFIAPKSGKLTDVIAICDNSMVFTVLYAEKNGVKSTQTSVNFGSFNANELKTGYEFPTSNTFSQYDRLHFRLLAPGDVPSGQIFYIKVKLTYD